MDVDRVNIFVLLSSLYHVARWFKKGKDKTKLKQRSNVNSYANIQDMSRIFI